MSTPEQATTPRTAADVDAEIARCNQVRAHVHDLDAAFRADRNLARLREERDQLLTEKGLS
jgi:hypothetical protein